MTSMAGAATRSLAGQRAELEHSGPSPATSFGVVIAKRDGGRRVLFACYALRKAAEVAARALREHGEDAAVIEDPTLAALRPGAAVR